MINIIIRTFCMVNNNININIVLDLEDDFSTLYTKINDRLNISREKYYITN